MDIQARDVTIKVIDHINLTADQWDPREHGTPVWREHMAKLLNERVVRIVPECDPIQFYTNMARYTSQLGFGDKDVVALVTEHIYNVDLHFNQDQAA